MHENTPYFFIFPFFEIFRGLFPLAPPYGATPGFFWGGDLTYLGLVFMQNLCKRVCYLSILRN